MVGNKSLFPSFSFVSIEKSCISEYHMGWNLSKLLDRKTAILVLKKSLEEKLLSPENTANVPLTWRFALDRNP
jgi:hypothetical protein